VTSKIKPIPIKPESIEIKTGKPTLQPLVNPIVITTKISPNKAIESNESTAQPATTNESKVLDLKSVKPIASQIVQAESKKAVYASHEEDTTKVLASAPTKAPHPKLHLVPIIATEKEAKVNPADILDGIATTKPNNKFFVQLIASKDKNKLLNMKKELAKDHIYAKLQSTKSGAATVYRLRVGPFSDKNQAKNELATIKEHLAN
jgi:cell division protein FtsN